MQFLTFVIPTMLQLYIFILLLRVWMQWVRADFYNPFSQFVVKITQPIVAPLRRMIPSIGAIDTATLVFAFALTVVNILFVLWIINAFALVSLTFIPISVIQLLTYAGKLMFWLLLIRALLSWVSQGNPLDHLLYQLTEPFMVPIRRIIPAMGGLDFSAMLVMLILIALNYLRFDLLTFIDPLLTSILYTANII